jgi:hypothetical protein
VAGGRLGLLSGLRHGAAGLRWEQGRVRCTGETAGAETADHRREAMGMLVRRFQAVVSLEVKCGTWGVLTDEGLRAVSSLPALSFLDLRGCNNKVTDEALREVSNPCAQVLTSAASAR